MNSRLLLSKKCKSILSSLILIAYMHAMLTSETRFLVATLER